LRGTFREPDRLALDLHQFTETALSADANFGGVYLKLVVFGLARISSHRFGLVAG
jgi:hypothetical protein